MRYVFLIICLLSGPVFAGDGGEGADETPEALLARAQAFKSNHADASETADLGIFCYNQGLVIEKSQRDLAQSLFKVAVKLWEDALWDDISPVYGDVHFYLAIAYEHGRGVKINVPYSRQLWQRAIEFGSVGAAFQMGEALNDDTSAAVYWKMAADAGHVKAQERLAGFYYDREHYDEAKEYAEKAAMTGHWRAMQILGLIYEKGKWGKDVQPDLAKAFYWYRRSVEHGGSNAYDKVIDMLMKGEGMDGPNLPEALVWLRKYKAFFETPEEGKDSLSVFAQGMADDTQRRIEALEKEIAGQ